MNDQSINTTYQPDDKVVLIDRRTSPIIWTYVAESNWRPNSSLLSCGDGVLHPYSNADFRHASEQELQENQRLDPIEYT